MRYMFNQGLLTVTPEMAAELVAWSLVVPDILTVPCQSVIPTVVVQLPLTGTTTCLVMEPAPDITKSTVEFGSAVPEMTRVSLTVLWSTGVKMMVAGSIFVSFFIEIVWDCNTLLAESVPVATNKRFPSLNDTTFTTTLQLPTGVTATSLELTLGVKGSESDTTTTTIVPGSPYPLTVTVGAVACEIMNWKLDGLEREIAMVVSLLSATLGDICVFPAVSVMVALSLIVPSLSPVMEVVTLQVPSAPTITGEEITLGVELSPSATVTSTVPPTSPVP